LKDNRVQGFEQYAENKFVVMMYRDMDYVWIVDRKDPINSIRKIRHPSGYDMPA